MNEQLTNDAATDTADLLQWTSEIVSSHLSNNQIPKEHLPELIKSVFATLNELAVDEPVEIVEEQKPAVPVKRSVTDDHIICLEDGKKLKMLKRHLKANFNMTPEEYRKKWNLPADYPMVAPNYTKKRQALAKQIGLGRNRAK